MTSLGVHNVIGGGVLKLERVQVMCPACGQRVDAIATDGRVRGYCSIAKQHVDFLIEAAPERKNLDYLTKPEYRANMSAAMKKLWQNPEYRAKHIATTKKQWQNPEYRAKHIAAAKKMWQNPEYRAKHITAAKKMWQNPKYRASHITATKKR